LEVVNYIPVYMSVQQCTNFNK